MNTVAKSMVVNLALPFAIDIVKDMITADNLAQLRDDAVALLRKAAGSTTMTRLDDIAVEKLVAHALTPENMVAYGSQLFGMIRSFVADTVTKWDDKLVLPLMSQLALVAHIPDEG